MTEHEWEWSRYYCTWLCKHEDCHDSMSPEEATPRLNATERLIAGIKDTHFLRGKTMCLRKSVGKDCLLCEAYADIMEGNEQKRGCHTAECTARLLVEMDCICGYADILKGK